jgi:YesN/AraC family two-component response regulator
MKKKNFFSYLRSLLGRKKHYKSIEQQMSGEYIAQLHSRLQSLMETEKPFLQRGYQMKHLADQLQIPLYQLSAFINQVVGEHFTDYINQLRIAYCEELLNTGAVTKPQLKELTYRCGFNNRNSFAAAFKKFTGKRFSEYIKQLKALT